MDAKSIAIVNLALGNQICNWTSYERIEWLELSETGRKLIYKDKLHRLYLLDILRHESVLLSSFAQYVSWIPGSDVIIAQSKDNLYIWYDLVKPVIQNIGQNVEAIGVKRENGQTKVLFTNDLEINLDETLIEFDTALEDNDLKRFGLK